MSGWPVPGLDVCPNAGEIASAKSEPSRATSVMVTTSFLIRIFLPLPRPPILANDLPARKSVSRIGRVEVLRGQRRGQPDVQGGISGDHAVVPLVDGRPPRESGGGRHPPEHAGAGIHLRRAV